MNKRSASASWRGENIWRRHLDADMAPPTRYHAFTSCDFIIELERRA